MPFIMSRDEYKLSDFTFNFNKRPRSIENLAYKNTIKRIYTEDPVHYCFINIILRECIYRLNSLTYKNSYKIYKFGNISIEQFKDVIMKYYPYMQDYLNLNDQSKPIFSLNYPQINITLMHKWIRFIEDICKNFEDITFKAFMECIRHYTKQLNDALYKHYNIDKSLYRIDMYKTTNLYTFGIFSDVCYSTIRVRNILHNNSGEIINSSFIARLNNTFNYYMNTVHTLNYKDIYESREFLTKHISAATTYEKISTDFNKGLRFLTITERNTNKLKSIIYSVDNQLCTTSKFSYNNEIDLRVFGELIKLDVGDSFNVLDLKGITYYKNDIDLGLDDDIRKSIVTCNNVYFKKFLCEVDMHDVWNIIIFMQMYIISEWLIECNKEIKDYEIQFDVRNNVVSSVTRTIYADIISYAKSKDFSCYTPDTYMIPYKSMLDKSNRIHIWLDIRIMNDSIYKSLEDVEFDVCEDSTYLINNLLKHNEFEYNMLKKICKCASNIYPRIIARLKQFDEKFNGYIKEHYPNNIIIGDSIDNFITEILYYYNLNKNRVYTSIINEYNIEDEWRKVYDTYIAEKLKQ